MIELDGIALGWPDAPCVQSGLSLRIAQGSKVALLGANGCGKSTLLQLLAGLVQPRQGCYRYRGQSVDVRALSDRRWTSGFRREVGLVFQHPEAMLFNPTVADEIAYGPRRLGWEDVTQRVVRWAGQLGLSGLLDAPPHSLSGGEKQKVALACVLILEPQLLLLDEPAANLDPRTMGWLCDYLIECPATVVMSTHNLDLAMEFSERCIILQRQRGIMHDGSPDAILMDTELLIQAGLAYRHRHASAYHAAHEHMHWRPGSVDPEP